MSYKSLNLSTEISTTTKSLTPETGSWINPFDSIGAVSPGVNFKFQSDGSNVRTGINLELRCSKKNLQVTYSISE